MLGQIKSRLDLSTLWQSNMARNGKTPQSMEVPTGKYIFEWCNFLCHVCFPEGTYIIGYMSNWHWQACCMMNSVLLPLSLVAECAKPLQQIEDNPTPISSLYLHSNEYRNPQNRIGNCPIFVWFICSTNKWFFPPLIARLTKYQYLTLFGQSPFNGRLKPPLRMVQY